MNKQAWYPGVIGLSVGIVIGLAIGYGVAQTSAGLGASHMFQLLKFAELGEAEERAGQAYRTSKRAGRHLCANRGSR